MAIESPEKSSSDYPAADRLQAIVSRRRHWRRWLWSLGSFLVLILIVGLTVWARSSSGSDQTITVRQPVAATPQPPTQNSTVVSDPPEAFTSAPSDSCQRLETTDLVQAAQNRLEMMWIGVTKSDIGCIEATGDLFDQPSTLGWLAGGPVKVTNVQVVNGGTGDISWLIAYTQDGAAKTAKALLDYTSAPSQGVIMSIEQG